MQKLNKLIKNPFVLNITANIFSYFVAFCGSIIYVHMLGETSFGLYTFSFNIISFFLLVNGFGAASGILQYVSRNDNEDIRQNYLRFAFQTGTLFNILISFLIILYTFLTPLPLHNIKIVLLSMAFFPVGRLYIDVFQAYMRARGDNVLQAKFSVINNSILLICNIFGIISFGLYGLIYSTYLAYFIMFIYSTWKFNLPKIFIKYNVSLVKPRDFISYSFFSTLSNAFSGLLFILDIIIIGYIIKDPKLVAMYRVATIIPFAINFIPGIIVNYYYAELAQSIEHKANLLQMINKVRKRIFMFSFTVSCILIILAQPIIFILFGKHYAASILPFQIVSFGYWIIATFRIVNGNVLAAMGKAKLSFGITAIVLVLNIIITYFMVRNYSINGAAMAVVAIYIISSAISYNILKNILAKMPD